VVPQKPLSHKEGFFCVTIFVAMLKPATIIFLISASALSVLHYLALTLYLYWQIWWFDIPMHVFGGAVIVLGMYTAVELRILPAFVTRQLFSVLAFVLVIALGWEVFQYLITEVLKPNYVTDTLGDIIVGVLGGMVGFIVGKDLQDLT
jgi:hypothetical protein